MGDPKKSCFLSCGQSLNAISSVCLTIDEFKSIRLAPVISVPLRSLFKKS